MKRFAGRVAVVTGAAGGIGRATALRLAEEGADTVLADLDAAALDTVAKEVGLLGGRVVAVPADVCRDADVEAVFAAVHDGWGKLDVLFNNAGITGPVKPIIESSEEELRSLLEVNVVGIWRVLRRSVPLLVAAGGGAIVNTSSNVGFKAAPMVAAYGASKQAVLSLTRSAAVELAPSGIRVNAVCPGPIETAMTAHVERSLSPEDPTRTHTRFVKATPLRRYGQPEEIAAMVAYLASDEASYVTGTAMLIDGGGVVA